MALHVSLEKQRLEQRLRRRSRALAVDPFGAAAGADNDDDLFSPLVGDHDAVLYAARFDEHTMDDSTKAFVDGIESMSYDVVYNEPFFKKQMKLSPAKLSRRFALIWCITSIIGVLVGLVAYFVSYTSEKLNMVKYAAVNMVLDASPAGVQLPAFLVFVAISCAACMLAAILVVCIAPEAGGSGIPVTKAFLNGSRLRFVLNIRVVIVRIIGLVLTTASGLLVGKEGPMVHVGASIASGVALGRSGTIGCDLGLLKQFQNDRDRRDFVACGTAAGISAAFGAPVGGVLFALEETTSHWSVELMWRALYCSMLSSFTLNFFRSGVEAGAWGTFLRPGLLDLFVDTSSTTSITVHIYDLIPFTVLAAVGGIIGALFNGWNRRLNLWRNGWQNRKLLRVIEVGAWAAVTCFFAFALPSGFSECTSRANLPPASSAGFVAFACGPGGGTNVYNALASLSFVSQKQAIQNIFVEGVNGTRIFAAFPLLIFAIMAFVGAVFTLGMAVPAGLWVPCILVGASFGRLYGDVIQQSFAQLDIHPGVYALVGAVAVLSGVTRMTISLTVIMLELTNSIQFLLPILFTIIISRFVGDLFNISLYDIHVQLKHLPYLDKEPPFLFNVLQVQDVMSAPVRCFKTVEKVGHICQVLQSTTFNGFPVVEENTAGHMSLVGLISRRMLLNMLRERIFKPSASDPPLALLDYDVVINTAGKDRLRVEDLGLSYGEQQLYIDVAPYMDSGPLVVYPTTHLVRAFQLFRALGVRHLPVVDRHNQAVGMMTRKELLQMYVQRRLDPQPERLFP